MGRQQILSSYDAVPSGDMVLESTRLVHTLNWKLDDKTDPKIAMYSTSHGTEIINDAKMYYFDNGGKLYEEEIFGNIIELAPYPKNNAPIELHDPIYAYRPLLTGLAYMESLFLKPRFYI